MNAEYFTPFMQAGTRVVTELFGGEVTQGDQINRPAIFTTQPVSIVVGVSGQVQGYVVYGMSRETALEIVSVLMGTPPDHPFDEMAISALCELGNIITGNATAFLAEKHTTCDLTPPAMIRGAQVEIATSVPAIVASLYTRCGQIDITAALKERAPIIAQPV